MDHYTRLQVSQHVLISKEHRHAVLHFVSVLVAGNCCHCAHNLSVVPSVILVLLGKGNCVQQGKAVVPKHLSLLLKDKDMGII